MPWPFSRNEPEPTDSEAGEGNGRRAEPRDPAAELRAQTRRRLIGAAALLLAAVLALPMLLDTAPRPVREDIAITIASPPAPVQKPDDRPPAVDEKATEAAPERSEPPPAEPVANAARPSPPPATLAAAQPAAPPAAAKPTAVAPSAEKFAVQVAALSTAAAAKDLAARLNKGGFSAYVEAVSSADSTLHRVRVGPFASREEAVRAAEKVKAAGHKATVVGG